MEIKNSFVQHLENNSLETKDVQNWLVSYLAELLEIDRNEVDITVAFERYGLDSAVAIGLTGDLGEWLGYDLDPNLLYDYPTIEALARHLVS
jgi:acyl carrier protein